MKRKIFHLCETALNYSFYNNLLTVLFPLLMVFLFFYNKFIISSLIVVLRHLQSTFFRHVSKENDVYSTFTKNRLL